MDVAVTEGPEVPDLLGGAVGEAVAVCAALPSLSSPAPNPPPCMQPGSRTAIISATTGARTRNRIDRRSWTGGQKGAAVGAAGMKGIAGQVPAGNRLLRT